MSTSRSPVGPLPAKVYWRRRLVVGLGLLAVIVAIVLIVVRPGQGAATPPSDPPASSPAAEPATPEKDEEDGEDTEEEPPADADGGPAACTAGSVRLEAVMDKDDYAQDELPQLSLTLTNIGGSPCLLQAGTDVQEYRITSGSDLIWSSKHCQEDQQPAEVVLEPDKSVSTTPFQWSRERSDQNTCEGERAAAVGGGATYVLQVFVGDLQSESNRFVLL
jgi:hypothetical protein